MSLPTLSYSLSSQNQRVPGYEIPGDEHPRIYSTENLLSASEMDELIRAAYRQIFHEQQMLKSTRQTCLESQLRSGQITVKQFIGGLATSDPFRRLNYDSNNNYRFVQLCVQRILGREVFNEREKLAWSTILATQGLKKFIALLLDSQEYQDNFNDFTVPYQRRRILPQRELGALPFARIARYGDSYRQQLAELSDRYLGSSQEKPYELFIAGMVLVIFAALFLTLGSLAGLN
jgi:phycobilisome rod-core linker protein